MLALLLALAAAGAGAILIGLASHQNLQAGWKALTA